MIVRKAVFVKSASKLEECPSLKDWNPQAGFPEFAMIGRSNVWKSSLINTLTNNWSLSKISTRPWKTQLINFFLINDERYLVDLPGYGYASSGAKDRRYWIDVMHDYFIGRKNLKRVFVLIDGSIPMQRIDVDFISSLEDEHIPYSLVMTKTDKPNQKNFNAHLHSLKAVLEPIVSYMPKIFPISNVSKKWREELLNYIQDLMW